MLQDKVIEIYCLTDDILKGIGHYKEGHRKVSDSEIITTALVSALYLKSNQSHAISYMRTHNMMPHSIHAVTAKGFLLFVFAYQLKNIFCYQETCVK